MRRRLTSATLACFLLQACGPTYDAALRIERIERASYSDEEAIAACGHITPLVKIVWSDTQLGGSASRTSVPTLVSSTASISGIPIGPYNDRAASAHGTTLFCCIDDFRSVAHNDPPYEAVKIAPGPHLYFRIDYLNGFHHTLAQVGPLSAARLNQVCSGGVAANGEIGKPQ